MKQHIQKKLLKIAEDKEINILFACESGSRAWGFPSSNSDYDVRFIFKYKKERYLSILEPENQFTFPLDENEIDLVGWDLKKCLQLINKSNSTVFEWLQSPIVYYSEANFQQELLAVCNNYFEPKVHIHHYLGIANTAFKTLQGQDIAIKKLFYILRPLLAARYCMEENKMAPMTIQNLLFLLPKTLCEEIQKLIEDKKQLIESDQIYLSPILFRYIEESFSVCRDYVKNLNTSPVNENLLNAFFLKELENNDY